MVSSARQAIACILVIFGAALCIQSQTISTKGPTATISGKVTLKGNGKGLPGIVVGLRLMESSNQRTARQKSVTDEEGNYRLSNVPPGNYEVVAVAPVFVSSGEDSRSKTLLITKDETIENINFALIRGGVITGRVTDSDGRPLVEQEVALLPVQAYRGEQMKSGSRTDERGIYRIFGVWPGSYRVAAGQTNSFDGRAGASYKQVFYPAASEISQAGIIEVTEGSETTNIDITLGRTLVQYSVRGRIVEGETGKPLANVPYGLQTFINENSSGSMSNGAVSNGDGEFRFDNLSPGKYAVLIEHRPDSEWRGESARFEVVDRDVTGLTVKLSKGASVSGVLVLEGTDDKVAQAASKRMQLFAYAMTENQSYNSGRSGIVNQDGSFRIAGLSAGTLGFSLFNRDRFQIVRIERDGIVYPKGIGIEIKEGEQLAGVRVIINYANGTIRGVIKLENGTLPPNASVLVALQRVGENTGIQPFGSYEPLRVDARGQFLQEGLAPGVYEVMGTIYSRDLRSPPPNVKQQVVVVSGGVSDVTLTLSLDSPSGRP